MADGMGGKILGPAPRRPCQRGDRGSWVGLMRAPNPDHLRSLSFRRTGARNPAQKPLQQRAAFQGSSFVCGFPANKPLTVQQSIKSTWERAA